MTLSVVSALCCKKLVVSSGIQGGDSYIIIRILWYFPGVKGQLSITPSGIVDVTEDSRFTISCSYIGSSASTYDLVTWFKDGIDICTFSASNCVLFGGAIDPNIVEYNCTNNGKDFYLTFKEVKKDQDGESWSCRVNTNPVTSSVAVTIKIKGNSIKAKCLKCWNIFSFNLGIRSYNTYIRKPTCSSDLCLQCLQRPFFRQMK